MRVRVVGAGGWEEKGKKSMVSSETRMERSWELLTGEPWCTPEHPRTTF